ncbi:MAG: hypothetical protein JNK29_03090 [Anaerolineales bacterium]|nr:hypothetical protein [Anaerolineales bacterium]
MPTPIAYQPKLEHLYNYVAASEIELCRLLESEQALQRQLAAAQSRREELLQAYGRPVTSPLQPDAYPARSLPREIIALNQAITRLGQSLADLRRQIQDQRGAVETARRALARYQAQPAGRAPQEAAFPAR